MSIPKTPSWIELTIGDVFEKIKTKKINGKAGDFPTTKDAEHDIPLLTSSSQNQGLTRFAPRSACPTILSNVISIASNGAAGETFYQEDEFAVLQDAYAIRPIGRDIPNRECGLFLASVIGARLRGNFDWSNKANWAKVKELKIKLPAIESEELDWHYMEKRIAELEAERIAELEAYLTATGLNDYELTDEDKQILATELIDSSKTGGQLPSTESGDGCWKEAREFLLNDIAMLSNGNKLNNNQMTHKKPRINFVSRTARSNGISDCVDEINGLTPYKSGCLTLAFGGSIGSCFLQPKPFYTGQNVGVIEFPDNVTNLAKMYISSVLSKKCKIMFTAFSDEINKHFRTDLTVSLPINEKKEPDYDYMDKYIRAIEKVTIKDIIKYKDNMIKYTKQIVSAD